MTRNILALCLIALFTNPLFAQQPERVYVNDGDTAALSDAIEKANDRPADWVTVIVVSGDFHFTAQRPMPAIEREITIEGSIVSGKARFLGPDESDESADHSTKLFHINSGASLQLSNLELIDLSLNHDGDGLIVNEGSLHIRQVQLSSVTGRSVFCGTMLPCRPAQPIILNQVSADLLMDQVSVVNSGIVVSNYSNEGGVLNNRGHAVITNSQVYLSGEYWDDPVTNTGTLDVNNSSFLFWKGGSTDAPELFGSSVDGITKIANSIISGFSGRACLNTVSIGYNLSDAADCNWSSEGDLTGVSVGLMWQPVEAKWQGVQSPSPILTHALVPTAASPAVDSANFESCSVFDLLGKRRNVDGCDRGAVELLPVGLAEGGINGLYFNPEADGHYLYILETDFTTLVVWTTFDADGNQAWVYGTGQLVDGRSVIADTYINRNGGYSPDGEIMPSEAEHWGRIEVDMTSCSEGLVAFYSDLPEFGNGQFPIERLANVKQLGCID